MCKLIANLLCPVCVGTDDVTLDNSTTVVAIDVISVVPVSDVAKKNQRKSQAFYLNIFKYDQYH